jgi:GT2 family glycosyltransferase
MEDIQTITDSDGAMPGGKEAAPEEASDPLSPLDIASCFQLFLGRTPEPSLVNSRAFGAVRELLREVLQSEEFRNEVLRAVLLRERMPQHSVSDTPPLPLLDWAQRNLPITAATRRSCGAARTWTQLLELLLSDATLTGIAPHLVAAEVDGVLRDRLATEPWTKVKRCVIGAVDAASGFEIRGWAVDLCDKSIPVNIEFYADSHFLGSISCNEPRADVLEAVGGDGRLGFTFRIPAVHRANFSGGRALVALDSISRAQIGSSSMVYSDAARHWDTIRATRNDIAQLRTVLERVEAQLPEIGRLASVPIEAYEEYWERFYRLSSDAIVEQRKRSAELAYRPLISVVLPTWNSDTRLLSKALNSVCSQTYDNWEVVVTDDASISDELRLMRRRYSAEPRIRWVDSTVRGGIAANTNRGTQEAKGEYIAFLDHDDELALDALFHVAAALGQRRYGLLYSDEDRMEESETGRSIHHTPFFKPDFDPDLLLSINYICHLVVIRRDVIAALGGLRPGFEGAQDHDLLLRTVAHLPANEILHLPRILYHWRVTPGSVSSAPGAGLAIQKNIVAAIGEQIQRLKLHAKVENHSDPVGKGREFAARIRWCLPEQAPKISIIIATRDKVDLLRPCLLSVLKSLDHYPGPCEILIADNDSVEPETKEFFVSLSDFPQIRLVPFRGPFNWSAINNAAAHEATGEVLIFLNNDTVVLSQDWCTELVANALREDVGAVGARLLYPDGTIQHSGVVLGVEGVAGHECVGETPEFGGYFGRSHLLRSAAAVTGACLATRRALFEELDGGFDDLNLKIAFNDVDYCMRVRMAGYRVVYNPFATLYHHESRSRGRDWSESQRARNRQEAGFFLSRWRGDAMLDPYYNPHFERFARPFERLKPPPELFR